MTRRPRRKSQRIVQSLVLLIVLSVPMQAAAGQPEGQSSIERLVASVVAADDPVAAYRALDGVQQQAVDDFLGNGAVEESTTFEEAAPAASDSSVIASSEFAVAAETCWTITKTVTFKNYYGTTLWHWKHRADWCGDYSKITAKLYRHRWGVILADFWSYRTYSDSQGGGVGFTYWQSFAQGEFKYCPPWAGGCLNTRYPWIDMTMRPNGIVDGSLGT